MGGTRSRRWPVLLAAVGVAVGVGVAVWASFVGYTDRVTHRVVVGPNRGSSFEATYDCPGLVTTASIAVIPEEPPDRWPCERGRSQRRTILVVVGLTGFLLVAVGGGLAFARRRVIEQPSSTG